MLRQGVSQAARVAKRGVATMPKRKAAMPAAGQSHGGHLNMLQREPELRKTFFNFKAFPEVLPLIGIVGVACGAGVYKLIAVDAQAPDTHWNKAERSTLDYIQNDKDVAKSESWAHNPLHVGPFGGDKKNNEWVLGIKR
uniref:Uncharacterized protein n=1 Tax=Mucochytrium quahogii TaxID=96639 RepID=A0A7S2S294_9STRA|mmetsp:Transcript_22944/g.36560  ORF Transcript_22944/g.36560 Transcript_22944/m.36560 type:complete len:139 (-) Transcript_22944:58-474(-)|eukprot:CAMPEP_0203762356 /NCGR_PEP_ID=MMETSP0098-20131031/15268_1 /ASSEMBLY_ACC=CAM_ASM_000208 /TAXON_ID=96639 /ORGANISM=" , Strain NY0313808BC1" /LENGTH=138 /DNA_ID=CAMNT_0050656741 /DNA_START=53 /DNA_END=469 /DNA_ORIENTATION=-